MDKETYWLATKDFGTELRGQRLQIKLGNHGLCVEISHYPSRVQRLQISHRGRKSSGTKQVLILSNSQAM